MLKKVLIIGNGFVGKNLFYFFNNKYDTTITNKEKLNVENEEKIKNYFYNKKFDIIIYAAGNKNIKSCESDADKAYFINSYAINMISKYAKFEKLIYLSTDYVFDGKKGNYSELDSPNPVTVYGKSKMLGEQFTLNLNNKGIVVRTSGIYGKDCTWIEWLNKEIHSNNDIECFQDVFNTPTYVFDLANMINEIFINDFCGIINLCGLEIINRYELFKTFLNVNNFNTKNLIISKNDGTFPYNLSLNNDKYLKTFNYKPLSLNDGFRHLKELM